ncbi:M12 family metallopeptidase [Pigmentibacter ruber]|uniref:M12 family metallopeptidase n=1 Tax=Pigmentibacter ruber TaxID=2683196 RepID=UPI00131DFCE8|nr:M12 family metallopeptidase [Pigmentibacter ruber]
MKNIFKYFILLNFFIICFSGNAYYSEERNIIQKSAPVEQTSFWPSGIVYYIIDDVFTMEDKEKIRHAMDEISSINERIRFEPREDQIYGCSSFPPKCYGYANANQPNYIHIVKNGWCWSYVGMIGGKQELSLGFSNTKTCLTHGTILHELMHALGFHHEQSRFDRDQFINIDDSNIEDDDKKNFKKNEQHTTRFGEYDFQSIMHYGSYDCAKDTKKPVLSKKDGSLLTKNYKLSEEDKKALLLAY